ncbi:hypothetical protein Fmac_005063 [Flemingia macrophylla]|uniref:non-specific serine/threonine protein kinase n=1 Tax=Flemingia macrophylla TaxID=520843 RepID=A0ABD1N721_9FABA
MKVLLMDSLLGFNPNASCFYSNWGATFGFLFGSDSRAIGDIVGGVSVGTALLFAAPAVALVYWKRRKPQDNFFDVPAEEDPEVLGHFKRFSLMELHVATENFNNKNIIGGGGFGKVYKGRLTSGELVAVKRMFHEHTEVEIISMAVHPNLLCLCGLCMTRTQRVPKVAHTRGGDLQFRIQVEISIGVHPNPPAWILYDKYSTISCTDRYQNYHLNGRYGDVLLWELLDGLLICDHCDPKFIHCDVKADYILIDENFEAVVGCFRFAKRMDYKDTLVTTTSLCGTLGHIPPENFSTGQISDKTHVFGYGVMLLEIIAGQSASDLARPADDDGLMFLDWVKVLLKDKSLETLVDADLEGSFVEGEVKENEDIIQQNLQIAHMNSTSNISPDEPSEDGQHGPSDFVSSFGKVGALLGAQGFWQYRSDLGNANLSGELVSELGQLPNLQYLELYRNNITGKIPDELGNLTNLVSLDFSLNNNTGPIPDNLANL